MESSIRKYSFKKRERLSKKAEINQLFNEGSSFTIYPLRFVYLLKEGSNIAEPPIQLLLSVPKKIHKKAVSRNLIKRRLKEGYRINKPSFYKEDIFKNNSINLGIVYISAEILTYREMEKKIAIGIKKLITEIEKRNSFY